MIFAELKSIKTSGFITNPVIDDAINNARWAFGSEFQFEEVSDHRNHKIAECAAKEGATFPQPEWEKAYAQACEISNLFSAQRRIMPIVDG